VDNSLTLLIDAASLIYRAFFSTPDTVRSEDGTLMNAAYGFISMLARLIELHDPDFICCAADDDWRPEWRVELIDTYKTSRAASDSAQTEVEDELEGQMPVIVQALSLCGIGFVGFPDHEAEDVIGTLAQRAPGRVGIVSGDRDLFQLVRDPQVFVIFPRRGVSVVDVVDESYIEKKYGIPGRRYLDMAILRGDPSDGLPGVRGIGEKIAGSLIARYGDLDSVVAAALEKPGGSALGKVRGSVDYIDRARRVATIPLDLAIPDVDLTRPRQAPSAALRELGELHGISGPLERLAAAIEGRRLPQ
jgi:5'-3' exonuclease